MRPSRPTKGTSKLFEKRILRNFPNSPVETHSDSSVETNSIDPTTNNLLDSEIDAFLTHPADVFFSEEINGYSNSSVPPVIEESKPDLLSQRPSIPLLEIPSSLPFLSKKSPESPNSGFRFGSPLAFNPNPSQPLRDSLDLLHPAATPTTPRRFTL